MAEAANLFGDYQLELTKGILMVHVEGILMVHVEGPYSPLKFEAQQLRDYG